MSQRCRSASATGPSWNFRDEIVRQQKDFLAGGGKFVVPIPSLEIVEN